LITDLYHSIDSNRTASFQATTPETEESQIEDLDLNSGSVTVLHDMFIGDDLTDGYSYMIAHSELGYQLTFMLKGCSQVVVAVQPSDDFEAVAHRMAKLMESGNRILRLRFDEPLNSTGGE